MKYRNTILATTTVILIIAVFSIFAGKKIKNKDHPILNPTIKVINLTADRNIDTIVNLAAQLLRLNNITVVCVPIENEDEAATYYAYVQDMEGYYLMRIHSNLSEDLLIESIAHESVHIFQAESGRLKTLSYGYWFEGLTYTFNYPYYDRKFEQEAFQLETPLKFAIIELTY